MQKEGLVKFLTQLSNEAADIYYSEQLVVLITNTEDGAPKTLSWIDDKNFRYGEAVGEAVERIFEVVSDDLDRMTRALTSQEMMDEEELNATLSQEVADSLKYGDTAYGRVGVFADAETLASDIERNKDFDDAHVIFVSWYAEDYHQKGYIVHHVDLTMRQYLTTKHD